MDSTLTLIQRKFNIFKNISKDWNLHVIRPRTIKSHICELILRVITVISKMFSMCLSIYMGQFDASVDQVIMDNYTASNLPLLFSWCLLLSFQSAVCSTSHSGLRSQAGIYNYSTTSPNNSTVLHFISLSWNLWKLHYDKLSF